VATPTHLFIRVATEAGPRNVELLEDGREIEDDTYRRRHRIHESSMQRGVFMRDLADEEVVAHLLSNQGIALARKGDLDAALARYALALKRAPLLVAAWYNQGLDLMNAGRVEEALASFDRAIELHPNDAEAHNNRGIAKARTGDVKGARSDFRRALQIEPGMKEAEENLERLESGAALR
jgi:Flp pilus assembly protein TadD